MIEILLATATLLTVFSLLTWSWNRKMYHDLTDKTEEMEDFWSALRRQNRR